MADLPRVFDHLNATIEREITTLNNPGLAIGLTDRERLLFVGTYGLANRDAQVPVNPHTLFQIGSISKAFTSIVLLQLQQEGRLHLDDPVTRHLPWFEVQSEFEPITLRHLMSHTAGIVMGADDTPAAHTEVWNLRHLWATAPPGEMFHYSNTGYKVLGLVLQTILRQPISEILRQRVLAPLGMSQTEPVITHHIRERLAIGYEPYYDDRPFRRCGNLAPATWFESETADGAICSTAADMCAYLRVLLNRGAGLLSSESFEQLITPVVQTQDGLHGEHYGLGLFIQQLGNHHIIGHSGGMVGYLAHSLADLDADLGIITLTNSPYDPERFALLAWELLTDQVGVAGIQEIKPGDPRAVKNGEIYTGRYCHGEKAFTVTAKGEHLFLEYDGEPVLMEPAGMHAFIVPHPAFALFLLRFECQSLQGDQVQGPALEAYYGPEWYIRDGIPIPETPEYPTAWQAYPGHYRSHNPWLRNFRVILRKGKLSLVDPSGDEEPLTPIKEGVFRVGADARSPETLQFDLLLDGVAMRANLSGGDYSRTFTP